MSFTVREASHLSPEKNRAILRRAPGAGPGQGDLAAQMIRVLADQGYPEVNLNLGCPVGTVTGKGKGSAMLRDVDGLRRFLDQVYAAPPAQVSVKTRIGWESPEGMAPAGGDLPGISHFGIDGAPPHPRPVLHR